MKLFPRKAAICLLAITTVLTQSGLADPKLLVDASKDGGTWWFPQGKEGFHQEKPHQGKRVADHMRELGWYVEELAQGDTVTVEMLTSFSVVLRPRPFFPYSPEEVSAYSSAINQGVGLVLLCQPSRRPDSLAQVFGLRLGLSQHVGAPTKRIRHMAFSDIVAGDGPWALIEDMPVHWRPLASIADGDREVYTAAYVREGDGHVLCLGTSHLRVAPSVLAEALQVLVKPSSSLLSQLRDAKLVTDSQSGPAGPHLVSPAADAALPQPSDLEWRFEWQPLPDVREYHLVVLGPSASMPLIDTKLTTNHYVHTSSGGYIAEHNLKGWTWRVRAQDRNSQWGDWSQARQFNVATLSRIGRGSCKTSGTRRSASLQFPGQADLCALWRATLRRGRLWRGFCKSLGRWRIAGLAVAAAALAVTAFWVSRQRRMKLSQTFGCKWTQYSESTMSSTENHESVCDSASGRKLIVTAMWWGRISAALGVLLILAIAADIVLGLTRPGGDTGGAMLSGFIIIFLFVAWVPVGLLSLVGAALSLIAWRKHQSREARTAFWLCLGNPIAGALVCGSLWLSFKYFNWF